jgi:RNA polymerase sigma factor (sigma-70 family)
MGGRELEKRGAAVMNVQGGALLRRTGAPRGPRRSATVRLAPRPAIVRHVAVARPDLEAERELCESAGSGDRAALGKILRRYGPILYRSVLLPRLGSDASAQDALAETYARVVERFAQFHWQACGIYPWLRVIALRIALDMLRAKRRELLYEPDDLEREIDASEQDLSSRGEAELCEKRDLADARAKVEAALAKLNPRYADAIRLRVLEERPREEVAAALGVSVSTFDVVLHRSMAALKKALVFGRADGNREPKETLR